MYEPTSTIEISQSVTLIRTGCDPEAVTARTPGDTSSEAIIDGAGSSLGTIIRIAADDVALQCLEVRNGSGDMIESEVSIARPVIQNNIVHHATGDEGMQIRHSTNALIQYNHVYSIAQDAINVCCGSDGAQILDNKVHDSGSANGAIYVYTSTNTTIDGNLVYAKSDNDTIKFGDGGDEGLTGGSVTNNVIVNGAQDAISVTMSDVLVDGNKIATHASDNGAVYVYPGTDNVTITNNLLVDNTTFAVRVNKGGGDTPTGVTVNNNCIERNDDGLVFVNNNALPDLNAENNWWNAADGPSGFGPGSGDSVSDNVDFSPFRTDGCHLDPIIDENEDSIPDGEDDPLTPPPSGPLCNGESPTILGTDGTDILRGTTGSDVIMALDGNDIIHGRGGDDIICSGEGNDVVHASRGSDWIDGGGGRDILLGRGGDDTILGGDGGDILNGGRGDDSLNGGDGFDICNQSLGSGSETSCEL